MYRIRFHGRGGQGIKTASRVLGTALFRSGFEVQDAPLYGAERRGAPLFASVRASHHPIHERGPIASPDLVLVADDTLVATPAVTMGLTQGASLVVVSAEEARTWRERLQHSGPLLTLSPGPRSEDGIQTVGSACAAAAARLVGEVEKGTFEDALAAELEGLGARIVDENLARARSVWASFGQHAGFVAEGREEGGDIDARPDWIDLPFEAARISAPGVHAQATSVEVRTGLWRTLRPVIDYDRCRHCTWICSTLCPDSTIAVRPDGAPEIDLDHCKGCMVCVAVCPSHAIESVSERDVKLSKASKESL